MSKEINPITTLSGADQAKQYGFVDPLKSSSNLSNLLYGQGGMLGGGPLGTFNQNADNVASRVAGLSGPLEASLSGLAANQANNALNSVASNFANAGALGSGAAARAFGDALANPFAQAQAQLQGSQLQAGGNALSNLLGLSGNAFGQSLGAAQGLMDNTSGLVAPTNMTNPEYAAQQQGKQAITGGLAGGLGSIPGILLGKK